MKQMLLCRNKSPPWSKSKVRLVEINDTPYSRNVWFFFKKGIYQPQCTKIWHHHKKLSDVLIRGSTIRVALFFPWSRFFSHWVFLARFLMRQQIMRIKRYVYSFSFTRIFSHRIFPSKVLTRHIIFGHPRWSVINPLNYVDCPLDILKT